MGRDLVVRLMLILPVLIVVSFATATALILTNKEIMTNYGFRFPVSLTSFHFLLSALTLSCFVKFGWMKRATNVSTFVRWYTAALGVASIVCMNWNLQVNSVGFYQLSKICNVPVTVAYKRFVKGLRTPLRTLLSLGLLLLGVGLFSVNDVDFNVFGAGVAGLAVLSTSLFQSRSAYMQNEYSVSGPQLNELLALPEFVLCACASLVLEVSGLCEHRFSAVELLLILLTGVFAVYGNVVGFVMIGRTGPVSFQVIGHAKTILVFSFGLILFPPTVRESWEQKVKKISGLVLAMGGVFLYTWFELSSRRESKTEQPDPTEPKEELTSPLTVVKFSPVKPVMAV